jgi:rhodanese-related sulfurtransferase
VTADDTVVLVKSRVVAAVFLAMTLAACGSGDDGSTSSLASPDAFAERVAAAGVVTINVHTPDEGSIPGTDLEIPFDEIASSNELPADLDAPLAVYCRSGNMSADAVEDLEALGYTDIVELDGGFNAWEASGRELEPTG